MLCGESEEYNFSEASRLSLIQGELGSIRKLCEHGKIERENFHAWLI